MTIIKTLKDSAAGLDGYIICQSRDCNLGESQILLVETPIRVTTSRVPDWDFYR